MFVDDFDLLWILYVLYDFTHQEEQQQVAGMLREKFGGKSRTSKETRPCAAGHAFQGEGQKETPADKVVHHRGFILKTGTDGKMS